MPWQAGHKYGSFKKILISVSELKAEAESIRNAICDLETQFYEKTMAGAEISFHVILIFLKSRLGNRAFLKTGRPLPKESEVIPFLDAVRFFGMPDTVRQALLQWNRGVWKMELIDYHPTGKEMLYAQSLGYRLTTIDWDACKNGNLIENKRDGLEHLLHDLAHAFMFFREDYDYVGQVRFFKSMYEEFDQFQSFLQSNSLFKEKFEYCISDMNSHPAHLQSYWTAIKREAGILTKSSL